MTVTYQVGDIRQRVDTHRVSSISGVLLEQSVVLLEHSVEHRQNTELERSCNGRLTVKKRSGNGPITVR